MKENKKSNDSLKVFFINTNQSNIDNQLEYSLFNNEGMANLQKVFSKNKKNEENNELIDYTISIFSFDIIPKDLKENNREKYTKKFKAIINLKYNNNIFNGLILFKESKSNFIFDFKFEKNNNNISPPNDLNLSKLEQLKLYRELFRQLNIKQDDNLSIILTLDAQNFFMGNNSTYYLDFFLETLKQCYSRKEVKTLLMMFKLDRVRLTNKLNVKEYSSMLNIIEKKPEIITKYCSQKDNKDKYLKVFYILLLYFRVNYEEDKVRELLNKKELWKFFIKILPLNYKYFSRIELPKELIQEIFHQKDLTYDIIKGGISYIPLNKNIFKIINNNCDSILEACIKSDKKLIMGELVFPKESDDLVEIMNEIGNIIIYQIDKKKLFIIFDEYFWKQFIKFNKTPEKIELIKYTISCYKTIDKKFNLDLGNIEYELKREKMIHDILYKECPTPLGLRIQKEEKFLNDEKNDIIYGNSNLNIISKRIVIPTIGNVSVGKSYFLNSLFGIDFCQVKSNITTKFILFIRHIDNLKEPRLYNLLPLKNITQDYFDFIVNGETIKGEKNIKEKINEVNNLNNNNPLFYMLEIEIKSINNKKFLNNVDFLDVPGLNESGTDYIKIYFKYLKDLIKYCLIIFSTENYNSKDAIQVINKVKNNIKVPMENFLLILNKIDKVNGAIEETLNDFKKIFLNNESINCFRNTIVPCNSLELKSEIQIETNFYHFINYYFIEYNKINKENEMISFLEYIKELIINIDGEKKKLLKIEADNLDENKLIEIKNIFNSFVTEKKNQGFPLIIDTEQENVINILKIFYICFINKLLVPKNSNTLKKINKYFDSINDFSFPEKNDINNNLDFSKENNLIFEENEEYKLLKDLDNFVSNTFNSPNLRKYGNIVPLLEKDFKILKNYILNSSLLYIPVLGISNCGKSSLINCLLEKDILICNSTESTKRGMIVRYIEEKDKISLYSIKLNYYEDQNEKYYYYTKHKLLSQNIDDIKEIIKLTNESYPKDEEDAFFLLEINIKFLDDMKITPQVKKNICFIDFPGHNTNNNLFFEKNIYQNVLKMSSFFIYMNSGKAIKEESNKELLSKLFREVVKNRIGDISPEEFIDLCLFIINKIDTLEEKEKNIDGTQDDIKEILDVNENFAGNITCSLFSCLLYHKFIEKNIEYKTENIIQLIENYYLKFIKQKEKKDDLELFGDKKELNFLEYVKTNLSTKIKFDYYEQFQLEKFDNQYLAISDVFRNINNYLENFIKEKKIVKDVNYQNNLIDISKLLIYCQENSKKLNYYKQSYAKDTFENLKKKIIKSFTLKKKEYENHLDRFFYFMNLFFRIETNFEKLNAKEEYQMLSSKIINNIENIFNEFKGYIIVKKYKDQILNYMEEKKNSYDILIQENNNDIDLLINLINTKLKKELNSFISEIEIELTQIESKIGEQMKQIGLTETGVIDHKLKRKDSFQEKFLLGLSFATFGIGTIVFGIGYGLFYALPNKIMNQINQKRKFNQFINDRKKYIEDYMNNISSSIEKSINKFKNISIENAKRLLGLVEANKFETDDFWKESKEKYLLIFNNYKKIKNLN